MANKIAEMTINGAGFIYTSGNDGSYRIESDASSIKLIGEKGLTNPNTGVIISNKSKGTTIYGDVIVKGSLSTEGNEITTTLDKLSVATITVTDTLSVTDSATFSSDVTLASSADKKVTIGASGQSGNKLIVYGDVVIEGNITVNGTSAILNNAVTSVNKLTIKGNSSTEDSLIIETGVTNISNNSMNISSNGDITVGNISAINKSIDLGNVGYINSGLLTTRFKDGKNEIAVNGSLIGVSNLNTTGKITINSSNGLEIISGTKTTTLKDTLELPGKLTIDSTNGLEIKNGDKSLIVADNTGIKIKDSGNLDVAGNVNINSGKFTIIGANGDVSATKINVSGEVSSDTIKAKSSISIYNNNKNKFVVDSIGDISTVNSITIGATESVSIKSGSITLNSDKFTVANTGAITSKAGITLNGSISGVKTEINGTSYNIINVNNISASGTITGDKGVYNAVWN